MNIGSQEQFETILKQLADSTKKYEAQTIKHYQWAEQVDRIFASYGWSKNTFYAELNARLGIITKDPAINLKAVKKKSSRKKAAV